MLACRATHPHALLSAQLPLTIEVPAQTSLPLGKPSANSQCGSCVGGILSVHPMGRLLHWVWGFEVSLFCTRPQDCQARALVHAVL